MTITRISRMLVPVDGSDGSIRGLELALLLAQSMNAKVTILEVAEDFGPLPGYFEAPPADADPVAWLADRRWASVAPTLEGTRVDWTRRVETGYPADTICRVAEEEDADLIVLGCQGLSAIGRFLVGSVSDRVVHHAPCSVTVVR